MPTNEGMSQSPAERSHQDSRSLGSRDRIHSDPINLGERLETWTMKVLLIHRGNKYVSRNIRKAKLGLSEIQQKWWNKV